MFAFRAGVFNVGGEGQLYLGAIGAALTALTLSGLPPVLLLPLTVAAGVLAGAVWGWIPAVLKVRLGVDEVVTTLMLNFVALLSTSFIVNHEIRDPTSYGPISVMIPAGGLAAGLPGRAGFDERRPGRGGPGAGLLGRAVPHRVGRAGAGRRRQPALRRDDRRRRAARIVEAMLVSGGFGGLAGALYVLGIGHRFEQNFSPPTGWSA